MKRIINTAPAIHKLIRQEYSVFLDWIFYHEAISEFTVRHWKVPYDGCGFIPTPRSPKATDGLVSKVGVSLLRFSSRSSDIAAGRGQYRLSD